MPRARERRGSLVAAMVLLASTSACGGEVTVSNTDPCAGTRPVECGERVRGRCIGVAAARSCAPESCACSSTVTVSTDAALSSALASAEAGSCIELAPGDYQAIEVPPGVTVFGRGHRVVSLASVRLDADATLCGLEVTGGVQVLDGAFGTKIQSVLVSASAAQGVDVGVGATAIIADSTIDGAGEVGVAARDAIGVALRRTIISRSKSFGVAAYCTECACESTPVEVIVQDSMVRDASTAGMVLHGVLLSVDGMVVADTVVGPSFDAGAGVSISCSALSIAGLSVSNSSDYGVGLFHSRGTVGAPGDAGEVDIRTSLGGMWIIDPGELTIDNAHLAENDAVGMGLAGIMSTGLVTIANSHIRDTHLTTLPILINGVSAGAADVGDGLLWMQSVDVNVRATRVSGSARASVLIDGHAQGKLDELSLEGGDAKLGIVQQRYLGGATPTISGTTPTITTTSMEVYPIPFSPAP